MDGRHRAPADRLPDDASEGAALLHAVTAIGAAHDLDGSFRCSAEAACALSQASYAVLTVLGDDGSATDVVTHGGPRLVASSTSPVEPSDVVGDHRLTVELTAAGRPLARVEVGRAGHPFDDAHAALLSRFAELAAPLLAKARAFDQSERRRLWLEGTMRVGAALGPATHTDEAVHRLVEGVRAVTGAELVVLLQDEADEGAATDGADTADWVLIAHDGDDLLAADVTTELRPRIAEAGARGELLRVERGSGAASLLIPLPTELAPRGVLLVEHAGAWSVLRDLERDLLVAFADHVALALDRAHAVEQRHELLIAADRDRIGRDLHDLVIQRLYATGLQLQAARSGGTASMDAAIVTGVRDIDTAIRDLRATIFELGRGIGPSLREEARALVQEYAALLGFLPILRLTGAVDTVLDGAARDQVLLVIREALSNVARHASATAVQVELVATAATFMVRVTDNGVGLVDEAGIASGLANARHRAEKLGGVLRLGPASPQGTSLVWLVPAAK